LSVAKVKYIISQCLRYICLCISLNISSCTVSLADCRLKNDLNFYRHLSKKLFRERAVIVNHVKHELDPLAVSNHQRYSVEDLHLLKSLVDRHGRKWKVISQEMGRWVHWY